MGILGRGKGEIPLFSLECSQITRLAITKLLHSFGQTIFKSSTRDRRLSPRFKFPIDYDFDRSNYENNFMDIQMQGAG